MRFSADAQVIKGIKECTSVFVTSPDMFLSVFQNWKSTSASLEGNQLADNYFWSWIPAWAYCPQFYKTFVTVFSAASVTISSFSLKQLTKIHCYTWHFSSDCLRLSLCVNNTVRKEQACSPTGMSQYQATTTGQCLPQQGPTPTVLCEQWR